MICTIHVHIVLSLRVVTVVSIHMIKDEAHLITHKDDALPFPSTSPKSEMGQNIFFPTNIPKLDYYSTNRIKFNCRCLLKCLVEVLLITAQVATNNGIKVVYTTPLLNTIM